MGERLRFRPEAEAPGEHPADRAWQALRPGCESPATVEVLVSKDGRYPNRKSRVYRLRFAEGSCRPVIAKRTRTESVRVERKIYEEILPVLQVARVRCFGALEVSDERAWIFLEEAPGVPYDEEDAVHLAAATSWLAAVHTGTHRLDLSGALPPHEPSRYRPCLTSGRKRIEPNQRNPALTRGDRETLLRILGHWDSLERHWTELQEACRTMPRCLVHGDFVKKNVRIHPSPGGAEVYALDWDIAGWGPPAVDIERLDPAAYRRQVSKTWPTLDLPETRRMANIGVILRNVGLIDATAIGLQYEWVERTMRELTLYEGYLGGALRLEGWSS